MLIVTGETSKATEEVVNDQKAIAGCCASGAVMPQQARRAASDVTIARLGAVEVEPVDGDAASFVSIAERLVR